jgi:chromate reductase, NAD(P)H dehydrogenase (quinone)
VSARILAVSGSLRERSSNSALVRAARMLAPIGVDVQIYDGLSQLPFFNPDLDRDDEPTAVAEFRQLLREADALLISSPEYAHGVPGVLKNALDWVVGSGELIDKPIALVNASPRATYAYASLYETLTTMTARIVLEASITVAVSGRLNDEREICTDPVVAPALRDALTALVGVAGWSQ